MDLALAVAGALLLGLIVLYNRIVRARVRVRQAWAQVDTQLQRRHDLVPNLVATVQAHAGHERDTLQRVADARAEALATADPLARERAEDVLTEALSGLLAIAEGYPQLRADGSFQALQSELGATEDRIAFARGFANDRVARYRDLIDTFPGVLVSRPLRMPREELFALADERASARPDVRLGDR